MEDLRQNPPTSFAGQDVVWCRDYTKKEFQNLQTGQKEENLLPPSNVLRYTLSNGDWVCVRPSGTEPKIKIYYGVKGTSLAEAKALSQTLEQAVCARMGVEA